MAYKITPKQQNDKILTMLQCEITHSIVTCTRNIEKCELLIDSLEKLFLIMDTTEELFLGNARIYTLVDKGVTVYKITIRKSSFYINTYTEESDKGQLILDNLDDLLKSHTISFDYYKTKKHIPQELDITQNELQTLLGV